MNKLLLPFLLLFSICSSSIAQEGSSSAPFYWYIQIDAFSSLENALQARKKQQEWVENNLTPSDTNDHHAVHISQAAHAYRVLIGPYASKTAAHQTASLLDKADNASNAAVLTLKYARYELFEPHYRLQFTPITKEQYQQVATHAGKNIEETLGHPFYSWQTIRTILEQKGLTYEQDLQKARAMFQNTLRIETQGNYMKRLIYANGTTLQTKDFEFIAYVPEENTLIVHGLPFLMFPVSTVSSHDYPAMPHLVEYAPNRQFRTAGDFQWFGESYVLQAWDKNLNGYVNIAILMDFFPFNYKSTSIHGLFWENDHELFLKIHHRGNSQTLYYKLKITPL